MKRLRFKNQPSTNTWKDISNTSTKKWMLPLIIILAILVIGMGNVWGQACATGGVNKGTLSFTSSWQNTAATGSGQLIYWQFSAVAGATYSFSNCGGTAEDTYMRIYNSSWTQQSYNDDYGPYCSSSTNSSLDWSCTTSGTYYVWLAHYSCSNLTNNQILTYKYTCNTPAQPSTITGTLDPIPGATGQTYSVTNVSGVTYTWSVPSGWTITAGQGTNSITVTVGSTNGNISVTPSNGCGNGTARTTATTIPNYRAQISGASYGSSTWLAGEARSITVTVKNTGVSTWTDASPDINVGVKWATNGSNWNDYMYRQNTGSIAPGATQIYTFSNMRAMNATANATAPNAPTYTSDLSAGTNYLYFDLVYEGCFWFAGNPGTACSVTCSGNSVYQTAAITIPLPGENCSNAQDLSTLTSPYSATTVGYADDISICRTGYSDRIFYLDVPNGYSVDIYQTVNSYDSYHYMGYGSSCPGTQIYCVDDVDTQNNPWTNSTGSTQRVWFIVDAYSGSGTFTLAWSLTGPCSNGDQNTYGSGSWIGYSYNSSSAGAFTTYKGYVTESETFDRDFGTGSATGATSNNLCSGLNTDLYAIRYKMTKNFTAGNYTFTVGGDDGVRLSLDGGSTWHINAWSDHGYATYSSSSPIYLSGNTNVILEYYENTGGARASFSYTYSPANPTSITVAETSGASNNDGIICSGSSATLTANGAVGTVYWFTGSCATSGQIGTGNSISVSPSSTTTYYARNYNLGSWSANCASTTITVNSGPTSPNAGSDVAICSGSSTQLNGSAIAPIGSATNVGESGLNVSIPDNNPSGITRTRTISNSNLAANQITSVNVAITHTFNADLDIYLISPSGYQIALAEDKGSSGSGYDCSFITGGATLPTTAVFISGNVSPQTAFSDLTGSADGIWTLKIIDDTGSDVGSLTSWGINYTPVYPLSYNWSPTTGLSNANIANPTASPSSNQTYTMTATSNSCSASDQVVVTVNSLSVAPTSISGTTNICNGSSTTLTTSGGTLGTEANDVWYAGSCPTEAFTEEWNSQPYSISTTTVNNTNNGILNVTSSSVDPQISMVNVGSFAASTYRYLNLRYRVVSGNASGGQIYFSKNGGADLSEAQSVYFNLVSDNTWRTLAIDMSSSANWTGTITGWRFDYASASGVTMDVDFLTLSNAAILGEGTSISVTPSTTTTYYTSKKGVCNTTACASTTVTIQPAINYGTVASGNQSICSTTTPASMTVSAATGSGSFTYQWYYQNGIVSAPSGTSTTGWTSLGTSNGANSATYTPPSAISSSTTYACFVTPGGSPTCGTATWASSARQITISTAPNAGTLSGTQAVCSNGTTTFTSNGNAGGTWTSGTVGVATINSSTGVITPVSAGTSTITYTVTGTGGCSNATATRDVTVSTVPTSANAGADQTGSTTCGLTQVTLAGNTPSVGTGAWSVITGTGGSVTTPSSASSAFTGTGGSTYTLRWTISNSPCAASTDDVIVTLNANPASANAGADVSGSSTCGRSTVTLAANAPSGLESGVWDVISASGQAPGTGLVNSVSEYNSTFTGVPGATYTLRWTLSNGPCDSHDDVTIELTQPTLTGYTPVNGDLLWGGLTDNGWSTSSNWYQYNVSQIVNGVQTSAWERLTTGEPSGTSKVMIMPGDGTCRHSTNLPSLGTSESVDNLTISSGATLNLSNGSMSVKGDFINNGTINPGSGSLSFDATTGNQTLGGSQPVSLNNLILNKNAGNLVVSTPLNVVGTLTMTKGNISNSSTITLGSSSASTGTLVHTAGVITGAFRRYFADGTGTDYFFPIGNSSYNRGVTLNMKQSPGTDQYVTAEYKAGAPQVSGAALYAGLPLTTSDGQLIQNYSEEGYWQIDPKQYDSGIDVANYDITFQMNNIGGVNDYTKTRIIKADGPSHVTWSALTHVSATGSNTSYALKGSGNGFSWFGGGGDNNNNPLPVELVSFTGACDEGIINLTWQTASEFNSSHFDVEKSRDGENWQLLTTLPSAGTSNELITYQSVDNNGTEGNNYFRLRQVDIDGTEKLYDPINVSCSEVTTGYFSSFPNPSGTSFQVVVNNKELIGTCTLNMVDASGKVIEQRTIDVKEGINLFVINQNLNPGIYFLNITNGAKSTPILRHAVN